MQNSGVQRAGSILGLFIFVTLVWYASSPRLLLAGVLYLMAATYIVLFSVFLATSLKTKQRRGTRDPAVWSLNRRAYVLLLFAWEVAIVGVLNIWAFTYPVPRAFTTSYVSAGIFIVLSYKLVALADSSTQDGGSMPLNYFGRPRSRRILFCGFVYTPIGMLALAGVLISLYWRWLPVPFQPPQLCLLLVALSSAMSAGMVMQRYRRAPQDKTLSARVLLPVLFGLVGTLVLQVVFGYSLYVYVLSSITAACIAATVYWLSLAREGGALTVDTGGGETWGQTGRTSVSPRGLIR
jgi:hypothetical protein